MRHGRVLRKRAHGVVPRCTRRSTWTRRERPRARLVRREAPLSPRACARRDAQASTPRPERRQRKRARALCAPRGDGRGGRGAELLLERRRRRRSRDKRRRRWRRGSLRVDTPRTARGVLNVRGCATVAGALGGSWGLEEVVEGVFRDAGGRIYLRKTSRVYIFIQ